LRGLRGERTLIARWQKLTAGKERRMPRYLIERRFHVGEDQMPDVNRKSKRIAQDHFPEIIWEHSHVAIDESGTVKTFCLYEAPSEDDVRAHAKELGLHDVDAIHEIVGDVTPGRTFRSARTSLEI
jgi:Protein of unknown function (DUF4242)